MNSQTSALKVGIASLIALITLFVGVFWLRQHFPLTPRISLTIVFEHSGNIVTGDPVQVSGLVVGRVTNVRLIESNRVEVRCTVTRNVDLREDAGFFIENVGLLGDKALVIDPGTSPRPLDYEIVHHGEVSFTFADIFREANNLIQDLRTLSQSIAEDLDIPQIIQTYEQTASELRQAFATVGNFAETNRMPLRNTLRSVTETSDRAMTFIANNDNRLREALDSFRQASESLGATIDTISVYLQPDGTLGKLLRTDQLHEELRKTNAAIDSLVRDIKEHPDRYIPEITIDFRLF